VAERADELGLDIADFYLPVDAKKAQLNRKGQMIKQTTVQALEVISS